MAMNKKTSIALAASAAMTAGLALSPMAAADTANPFQSAELTNGYMQLAKHHEEGKCGEAKCGGEMKDKEAKCGEDMKGAEGKCGEDSKKDGEGKCGEAKCGNK